MKNVMKNMNELLGRKPVGQPSVPTLNFLIGDRSCNMNCKYCISKMTTKALISKNSAMWNARFPLCFSVAEKFGVRTVLVTGKGEPTLWIDEVKMAITEANRRGFITELQTNGLLLTDQVLDQLSFMGLNTIAISRVAFRTDENDLVCENEYSSPNLFILLEKIISRGINVRLSFLGMKGYNDTYEKIIMTCRGASKFGVKEVTIRRMGMPNFDLIESSQKAIDVKEFVTENLVGSGDWEKIIDKFKNGYGGFAPYPVLQIFDWGTVVWAVEGVSCAISDCLSIPGVQGSIRYLIYCPDGHMRYSWEYDSALIF